MTTLWVCVVTVWLASDEALPFRASLRPVGHDDALIFTDPASLAGFFYDLNRGLARQMQPDASIPSAG